MGNRIISNLLWRFLERCGAQGVTFIVSIVLARILDPVVYGTIALVLVFLNIMQVFIDGGLGNALIQKIDSDDLDFSTVFYFNVAICCIMYLIVWIVSPWIAQFYDNSELIKVIRVLGLIIIISSIKNIQQSYVSKYMLFKKFFFSTLGGTIAAAIVGICLACNGFGVWALVFQMLANTTIDTIILYITVGWKPKRMFSFQRLRSLFSFGWKLMVSQMITVGYVNLRQLIIGRVYSADMLAYYNQGEKIPNLVVTNINTSIDSVLFPALSAQQESIDIVRDLTRKAIRVSSFVMMPMMVGIAVCADALVKLILTEKWIHCVPFLRVFCFVYAFYPLHTANLNAIKAVGYSEIYLKLEIIKDLIGLTLIVAFAKHGTLAIAVGYAISTVFAQVVNAWPNKKLLNYSYIQQIRDILPNIVLSVIMGAVVYLILFLNLNRLVTLVLQIILGIIIYVFGSLISRNESMFYFIMIIKNLIKKE